MPFPFTIKLVFIVFIGLIFCGCSKKDPIIIDIQTPESSFTTLITSLNYPDKVLSKVCTLDSTFYFVTPNQIGDTVTYQWDFGDGNKSILQNPKHVYTATGNYKVKLTASRGKLAVDTTTVIVSVITGEIDISLGKTITTAAISILENKNEEFLMLGYSKDIKTVAKESFFLMKLDKNFRRKSLYTFPANTRLNSMSACTDGNYIFTGSTSGKQENVELIKTAENGTIIWTKTINCNNLTEAQQTSDGGFILAGSREVTEGFNKVSKTLIVKTDATGNLQWETLFTGSLSLSGAANVAIVNDGYVFGAVKKNENTNCFYCDSVSITKLDTKGTLIWKKAVAWGLNEYTPTTVTISKMKNGSFSIIGGYYKAMYFFSSTGEFNDRKLLPYQAVSSAIDNDGNISILLWEVGNGFRSTLLGHSDLGVLKWRKGINGCVSENGGTRCSMDSWPITVKSLANGGSLFVSNRVHFDDYHYSIVLAKVGGEGELK